MGCRDIFLSSFRRSLQIGLLCVPFCAPGYGQDSGPMRPPSPAPEELSGRPVVQAAPDHHIPDELLVDGGEYFVDEYGNYQAGGYGGWDGSGRGWIANAEYLLWRPHFSEVVAFARGNQTLGATIVQDTEAVELDFDYDSSFRLTLGTRGQASGAEFRFTYSQIKNGINVDGTPGAGGFLVDPFGNVAGTVVVVDPHSALAGIALPAGDAITTHATVELDLYDAMIIKPIGDPCGCGTLSYSFGARIADVEQYYGSTVTLGGNFFSGGDFEVDFIGAGPRVGAIGERRFGRNQNFSLLASAHASLLVGQYDVVFNNRTTIPPAFDVSQTESVVRTIPVMEIDLGASWHINHRWTVTSGWSFQSWLDFGASGGKFGGFFAGADDSNIMSFDGLFARAEARF
jgi:hypothetical protein